MNLAIFASVGSEIYKEFIVSHYNELKRHGLKSCTIILDTNEDKKDNFLAHSIKIAKRQSKYANCHWLLHYINILFFKVMTRKKAKLRNAHSSIPREIRVFEVGNLNSSKCIEIVKMYDCDAICLMGTRIISAKTLKSFGDVQIFNIHSSDPEFVRGGPSVFWEVLAGEKFIVATIHKVIAALDAGEIYMQRKIPIAYNADLGITLSQTMVNAVPIIAALYCEVLQLMLQGNLAAKKFTPGILRVTPSVFDVVKAKALCRKVSIEYR